MQVSSLKIQPIGSITIVMLSVFNMVHVSNSISTVNKKDFGGTAIFFSFSCSFLQN